MKGKQVKIRKIIGFMTLMMTIIMFFSSGSGIYRESEIFSLPNFSFLTDDSDSISLYAISDDYYSDAQRTLDSPTDIDIDAAEGWEMFDSIKLKKRQVVVAVIDTGVDILHEDLSENIWVNPGEIPDNGIDDDGNGYVDDVYGWDFYNDDNTVGHFINEPDGTYHSDPDDCDDHGSHVAGIIAAVRNNEKGIAGVASCGDVKIMVLKIHGGKNRSGKLSNAVKAIKYAEMMGADICNISWGSDVYNEKLFQAMAESKMLFCVAAGNSGTDIDEVPIYPAGFHLDNVITVAFSGSEGKLSHSSSYGKNTVDVAVPAGEVYSTIVGGYKYMGGSSMATPHVTGLAALLYSIGVDDPKTVRDRICANVTEVEELKGFIKNPGIINMKNTLSNNGSGLVVVSTDQDSEGEDSKNDGTGSENGDDGSEKTGDSDAEKQDLDDSGNTDDGKTDADGQTGDNKENDNPDNPETTDNDGSPDGQKTSDILENAGFSVIKTYDGDSLRISISFAEKGSVLSLRYFFGTKSLDVFKKGIGGLAIIANSVLLDKEGKYTFYYKDADGNEAVKTYLITDDTLPPRIENTEVRVSFDYSTISINADVFDLQSGIKKVKLLKGKHEISDFTGKDGIVLDVIDGKISYDVNEEGTYTLYACDLRGNKTVKNVMCYIRKAKTVSLEKSRKKMKKGTEYTLEPVLYPALSTDAVKFSSSDKKVASVDENGVVRAKNAGEAVITVKTASGATTEMTVIVSDK